MNDMPWWAYLLSTALTGLLAAGGVVAGQLVAARHARSVAASQGDLRLLELDRAAQDAERDRRADAYLAFVPAVQRARIVLLQVSHKADDASFDALKEALAEVNRAEATVDLYGSERARNIATVLINTLVGNDAYLGLKPDDDDYEAKVSGINERFWENLRAFLKEARADVNGHPADIVEPLDQGSSTSPPGAGHQGTDNHSASDSEGGNHARSNDDEPGSSSGDRQ